MAFTISLNGNNFISDKRKAAFENALEDTEKVNDRGNGKQKSTQNEPESHPPSRTHRLQQSSLHAPRQPEDDSRLFEMLELGLKQSYGHQTETLKVHQQYLHNQADYANIFSQLMQQQSALYTNRTTSEEQTELTITVIKSLSSSIEQFHKHQSETLNVHNQFLNQQSAYSQAFVQLLKQQIQGTNGHDERDTLTLTHPTISTDWQHNSISNDDGLHAPERLTSISTDVAPSTATVFEKTKVDTAVRYALPSSDVQSEINNTLIKETLMSIVSEKTGYPEEMLEPEMDMETDLGIDSIKRVEILGALQDQVPALPELDADDLAELRTLAQIINYVERCEVKEKCLLKPQMEMTPSLQPAEKTPRPAPFHAPEVREITTTLMSIVSEKTGYPVDMLELDMDMEADLGIDSIKRVEILGALQDQVPDIQEIDADALTELRTLRHIIGYIEQQESKEKKV